MIRTALANDMPVVGRRRTVSFNVDRQFPIQDERLCDVRGVYLTLSNQLKQGNSARTTQMALTYFSTFVEEYNTQLHVTYRPSVLCDPSRLNCTQQGIETAQQAWSNLINSHGWKTQHLTRVRTHLSRALRLYMPGLLRVVNPGSRETLPAAFRTTVRATRSHEHRFELHDSLPLLYRKMDAQEPSYRLMTWIGEQAALNMRTVSRKCLQQMLHMAARVMFLPGCNICDLAAGVGLDALLTASGKFNATDWLKRFALAYPGNQMSFRQFKRRMYHLRMLHRMLCPNATILIPRPHLVFLSGGPLHSFGGGSESEGPLTSSGLSEDDDHARRVQADLYAAMEKTQRSVCKLDQESEDRGAMGYALTPQEVYTTLSACTTVQQRLVFLIFLTTGLRIGGLARIRLCNTTRAVFDSALEVPCDVDTVEKNGIQRKVRLTGAVRVLISQWSQLGGLRQGCPYLFPSLHPHQPPDRPVSLRHIWKLCCQVFLRAGVTSGHPHMLRHTFVHMLWHSGTSWEVIAKFVGHSSPAITEGTYGRLRQQEILSDITGVNFLSEVSDNTSLRQEWRAVGAFLRDPWHFAPTLWEGLGTKRKQPSLQHE